MPDLDKVVEEEQEKLIKHYLSWAEKYTNHFIDALEKCDIYWALHHFGDMGHYVDKAQIAAFGLKDRKKTDKYYEEAESIKATATSKAADVTNVCDCKPKE